MRDMWRDFLLEPTARNYLRVRQRILRYRRRPDIAELARLVELFETRQFAALVCQAEKLLPRWSLCPRFYRLTGLAYYELGKHQEAQIDRFLYESCLLGILATGDGSQDIPFWVTYPPDPDEVVEHLQVVPRRRVITRGAHGVCEVIQADEGRQWWFTFAPAELRKYRPATASARATAYRG